MTQTKTTKTRAWNTSIHEIHANSGRKGQQGLAKVCKKASEMSKQCLEMAEKVGHSGEVYRALAETPTIDSLAEPLTGL